MLIDITKVCSVLVTNSFGGSLVPCSSALNLLFLFCRDQRGKALLQALLWGRSGPFPEL